MQKMIKTYIHKLISDNFNETEYIQKIIMYTHLFLFESCISTELYSCFLLKVLNGNTEIKIHTYVYWDNNNNNIESIYNMNIFEHWTEVATDFCLFVCCEYMYQSVITIIHIFYFRCDKKLYFMWIGILFSF